MLTIFTSNIHAHVSDAGLALEARGEGAEGAEEKQETN